MKTVTLLTLSDVYQDDVVLLADNIGHIQHSLNLASFCNRWGLTVNMKKDHNFISFGNGGIVKKNESVYFKGFQCRPTPTLI